MPFLSIGSKTYYDNSRNIYNRFSYLLEKKTLPLRSEDRILDEAIGKQQFDSPLPKPFLS